MKFHREFRVLVVLSAAAILIASAVSLRAAPRVAVLGTPITITGPAAVPVTIPPGVTVDLRNLPKLTPGEFRAHGAMPFRVPNPAEWSRQKESGAAVSTPSVPAPPAVTLTPPTLWTNFAGIDQPSAYCNCEPPDTNVAAGPNQVAEVVNLALEIFDKSGNVVQGPVYLNNLFGIGPNFSSDPKVRYDPVSQRWFISMLSLNNTSDTNSTSGQIDLAVSSGPDPTATWKVYTFPTPSELPDQPDMGFSSDKVVLSDDAFPCSSKTPPGCEANGYLGNDFFVIRKSDLTSGASSPATDEYGPGYDGSTFSIQPARMMPGTSPQPTTLYMASVVPDNSSVIHVYTVTGVPSGSNSPATNVAVTSLPISQLTDPPYAHQPSGTITTYAFTGDNRLEDAVWQDGALWVSANSACTPAGDNLSRDCLRYIEVLTDGASGLEVNQDFDYGVAGTDLYYPAIALDQSDDLVSVFSQSSSVEYPSVYFASRLESDPVNTMSAPVLIEAGSTNYTGQAQRWGDYSGASIDPSDTTKVWIAGEYASSVASPNWGTWIAEVEAGSSTAPTPTARPTATPVPLPGKLRVSTHRLHFGKTMLGGFKTRTLKIRNKGRGPLTISLVDPQGPFSIVGGPTTLTVAAKQKVFVTVQFAPAATGRITGSLSLSSDDPKHPTASIKLIGKGVGS